MHHHQLLLGLELRVDTVHAVLFNRASGVLFTTSQSAQSDQGTQSDQQPVAICNAAITAIREALDYASALNQPVSGIGIASAPDIVLVWNKVTGAPLTGFSGGDDPVGQPFCDTLRQLGADAAIRALTGLPLSARFAASRIRQLLNRVQKVRSLPLTETATGTIDSWLIWHLSAGRYHVTDPTHASRSLLYNLHDGIWDQHLLGLFGIPIEVLPRVSDSSGSIALTDTRRTGREIPIYSNLCNSQANCAGYGSTREYDLVINLDEHSGSMFFNSGARRVQNNRSFCQSVMWQINGSREFADVTPVSTTGIDLPACSTGSHARRAEPGSGTVPPDPQQAHTDAAISRQAQIRELLRSPLTDSTREPLYLVPEPASEISLETATDNSRSIHNLKEATNLQSISRARMESMCFQIQDMVEALRVNCPQLTSLYVTGELSCNDKLVQFLADICNLPLRRHRLQLPAARGAACLAGLQTGLFDTAGEIATSIRAVHEIAPTMPEEQRQRLLLGWFNANRHRDRAWQFTSEQIHVSTTGEPQCNTATVNIPAAEKQPALQSDMKTQTTAITMNGNQIKPETTEDEQQQRNVDDTDEENSYTPTPETDTAERRSNILEISESQQNFDISQLLKRQSS